jgi:hypothetical protein
MVIWLFWMLKVDTTLTMNRSPLYRVSGSSIVHCVLIDHTHRMKIPLDWSLPPSSTDEMHWPLLPG